MSSCLWKIELMGQLCLTCGETTHYRFRLRKTDIIFAFLAVHKGISFRREQIIAELWPDLDDKGSATTMRQLNNIFSQIRSRLKDPRTGQQNVLLHR